MIRSTRSRGALLVLGALLAGCDAGHGGEEHARTLDPAIIVIEAPDHFGHPERPPTEFDHAAHVEALGQDGSCSECHDEQQGRLVYSFHAAASAGDMEALREAYHDGCVGCHEERAGQETGPTGCGECHQRRAAGQSTRLPMRWDLSLHARHVESEQGRCNACHHEWDERSKRTIHVRDRESSCADCHHQEARVAKLGGQDVRVRSLREASHGQCVDCHRREANEGAETGPVSCAGCHSAEGQAAIERLETIPRLMRGQPDNRFIHTDGATSKLVSFNHEGHERVAARCSDCHHQTLRKCGECHTVEGSAEGGQVTLERAYHDTASPRSCVGCHQQRLMGEQACAGCHWALNELPGEGACERCHDGPPPALAELNQPRPPTRAPESFTLPEAGDDFPTTVTIDALADRFGPSSLPHRRIVESLARGAHESALAARFHGGEAAPCAGCHHNTPPGERPPACATCHGAEPHPTLDQPDLTAAYHRQCIGCHQRMDLETGCTVCHEEARRREGSR